MRLRHLIVLGLTALFLLTLEVGLEFRAHRRGFETLLFGPGRVRFASAAEGADEVLGPTGPTDEFPFRSPVVPIARDPNTIRVWVADASAGEDVAVPVPGVFPNRIGEILRQGGWPVEVLNAARAGISISDNTSDLRGLGREWRPDYALMYGLGNDLNELSKVLLGGAGAEPEGAAAEPAPGPVSGPVAGAEPEEVVSGPFLRLNEFYERTTIFAQLKSNLTSQVTLSRLLTDSLPPAAPGMFRARVEAFVDAAVEVGATPILITSVTSHTLADLEDFPRQEKMDMARYNPFLSPRGWLWEAERMIQVIRDVARDRGVLLIDLDQALTDRDGMFRDLVHFSPEGHEAVASIIASAFAEAVDRDGGEAGR